MRKEFINSAVAPLGFLSFAGLVAYFLALHDIHHDYASPELMSKLGVNTAPDWTSCPLEWAALQVGFLLMLAFHILFFVTLARNRRPLVIETDNEARS